MLRSGPQRPDPLARVALLLATKIQRGGDAVTSAVESGGAALQSRISRSRPRAHTHTRTTHVRHHAAPLGTSRRGSYPRRSHGRFRRTWRSALSLPRPPLAPRSRVRMQRSVFRLCVRAVYGEEHRAVSKAVVIGSMSAASTMAARIGDVVAMTSVGRRLAEPPGKPLLHRSRPPPLLTRAGRTAHGCGAGCCPRNSRCCQ
jgi:hypothetical protein